MAKVKFERKSFPSVVGKQVHHLIPVEVVKAKTGVREHIREAYEAVSRDFDINDDDNHICKTSDLV